MADATSAPPPQSSITLSFPLLSFLVDRFSSLEHCLHQLPSLLSSPNSIQLESSSRPHLPYSTLLVHPVPSVFQMPLHYPRYRKPDYESMPEAQLDRLLEEYGLPVTGCLSEKRDLAIGTFLWKCQRD